MMNKREFFCKKVFRNKKRSYICSPKGAGTIAQLVEQRTENPCVAGSIPADTTKTKRFFRKKRPFFMRYR